MGEIYFGAVVELEQVRYVGTPYVGVLEAMEILGLKNIMELKI